MLTKMSYNALKFIGNTMYNFKGISSFKSAFKAESVPRYLAFTKQVPIFELLQIYAYCMGLNQDLDTFKYSFTREN